MDLSQTISMIGLIAVATCTFFGNPSIDIGGGRRAHLAGSGPPVVFSTGLFGTMPGFFYSDLFRLMKQNVTLVTLDGRVTSQNDIKRVANALGVSDVGLMTHSSFDASVLGSPYIRSAVLCDPIVVPSMVGIPLASSEPFAPTSVDASYPVLAIRAERAYDAKTVDTVIPDFLEPRPKDGGANWRVVTIDGVGHADMLDDTWAGIGAKLIPWINGPSAPTAEFRAWSPEMAKPAALKNIRDAYRTRLAALATEHFLDSVEVLPPATS